LFFCVFFSFKCETNESDGDAIFVTSAGPSILRGESDFYLTSRSNISCVQLLFSRTPRIFPQPVTMTLKPRPSGLQIEYETTTAVIQVIGNNHGKRIITFEVGVDTDAKAMGEAKAMDILVGRFFIL